MHPLGAPQRLIALANGLNRLIGRAKGTEPLLVRFIPVEAAEGRDWHEVLDGLREFEEALRSTDLPAWRRMFLGDVLAALAMQCREGLGEVIPFSVRVATYLGVPGEPVSAQRVDELEGDLEDLLRGRGFKGSLPAMLREWRAATRVPSEEFESQARTLMDQALRETHAAVVPLPTGTAAEFQPVRNVFYNGYSRATGHYTSAITLNADLEWTLPGLRHVIAHESFPGHSALNAIRQDQGQAGVLPPEAGIYFANTPITPVIEGTCNLGARLLGWCTSADDEIADLEKRYRAALSTVWVFNLHQDGWTHDRLIDEMMHRRGIPRIEAETHVRFLAHPLWCTSIPHYYYGTEAVREAYLTFTAQGRQREFTDVLYREVHTYGTLMRRCSVARPSPEAGGSGQTAAD